MADRQIVIAGDPAHERLSQGGNADHQKSQQDGSDQDRRRSPNVRRRQNGGKEARHEKRVMPRQKHILERRDARKQEIEQKAQAHDQRRLLAQGFDGHPHDGFVVGDQTLNAEPPVQNLPQRIQGLDDRFGSYAQNEEPDDRLQCPGDDGAEGFSKGDQPDHGHQAGDHRRLTQDIIDDKTEKSPHRSYPLQR